MELLALCSARPIQRGKGKKTRTTQISSCSLKPSATPLAPARRGKKASQTVKINGSILLAAEHLPSEVAAAQPSGAAGCGEAKVQGLGMASAGRVARRDRGAVHVHSAALLQQLLDAAQRLQEHPASAARDLPGHPAAASCVSIAQACAVPTATHGSTATHPPEAKPAPCQPSPDPASTPGGASALPGAPPDRPDGVRVAAAALPGGRAEPLALPNAQLFPCQQEPEPRLPEAGAQGGTLAEQAAAASCPSNAPGAGLEQMLASIAAGLDPDTGVVAEVAAVLAADAAARAGQGIPGPRPGAHRRSCVPRRPAASLCAGLGRMPRNLEQPPWGRSGEGVDRRRAGRARWRMRQGGGAQPGAGDDPVTEGGTRGGARTRAMLPATEWTRVRPPAVSSRHWFGFRFLRTCPPHAHRNALPYWQTA